MHSSPSDSLLTNRSLFTPLLGSNRLFLPSSRADAITGLGLLAPSSRVARIGLSTYSTFIRATGTRFARKRRQVQPPQLVEQTLPGILTRIGQNVGPPTGVAVAIPRQRSRPRAVALLIRDGTPIAFVKLNQRAEELEKERRALEAIQGSSAPVRIPRVIDHGLIDGVAWMATTTIPTGRSEPVMELPFDWQSGREFAALEPVLGHKPDATYVALHGDLAPWNLRRAAGDTWLLDWEDARWGPSGADEAYFHATASVVCGAPIKPCDAHVAEYWKAEIRSRQADEGELELARALHETLDRMAAVPPPQEHD